MVLRSPTLSSDELWRSEVSQGTVGQSQQVSRLVTHCFTLSTDLRVLKVVEVLDVGALSGQNLSGTISLHQVLQDELDLSRNTTRDVSEETKWRPDLSLTTIRWTGTDLGRSGIEGDGCCRKPGPTQSEGRHVTLTLGDL